MKKLRQCHPMYTMVTETSCNIQQNSTKLIPDKLNLATQCPVKAERLVVTVLLWWFRLTKHNSVARCCNASWVSNNAASVSHSHCTCSYSPDLTSSDAVGGERWSASERHSGWSGQTRSCMCGRRVVFSITTKQLRWRHCCRDENIKHQTRGNYQQ